MLYRIWTCSWILQPKLHHFAYSKGNYSMALMLEVPGIRKCSKAHTHSKYSSSCCGMWNIAHVIKTLVCEWSTLQHMVCNHSLSDQWNATCECGPPCKAQQIHTTMWPSSIWCDKTILQCQGFWHLHILAQQIGSCRVLYSRFYRG